MRMKIIARRIILAVSALLCGGSLWAADPGTTDGTLTVTPVVSVSLELAPTTYAFGSVDVGKSTHSLSMQGLHNIGTVGVTMQKSIQIEPSGWTAGDAAGTNVYVLYAATTTLAAPPDTSLFTSNSATKFLPAGGLNGLNDGTAGNGALPLAGSTTIWYRLDMPLASSSQAQRTITVRYTGTAQ
ncbi:MAG: hypothetical protein PHF00_09535 [Elusimicrobia bacterium]|nr:hypothetical protein [Elusimicrobiota bacterium]